MIEDACPMCVDKIAVPIVPVFGAGDSGSVARHAGGLLGMYGTDCACQQEAAKKDDGYAKYHGSNTIRFRQQELYSQAPSFPVSPFNKLIGGFEIGDAHIFAVPFIGEVPARRFHFFHFTIYRIFALNGFAKIKAA